jgi:hypothetical protein
MDIQKKKSISLLSKIIRFQKKPLNYIIGYVITSPQPSLDNLGRYYESEDYISHTDSVLIWESVSLREKHSLKQTATYQ